jgi:hypothetical protein
VRSSSSVTVVQASANGAIAQLGEHLLCKQGVVGSIPTGSTIPGQATDESFRSVTANPAHGSVAQVVRAHP